MIFNEVRDTFLTFNKYHIFHQPSIWFCSQFRSSKLLHFVDQNNCQILVRLENSSPNFIWYLILLPSRKQLFCKLKTITLATDSCFWWADQCSRYKSNQFRVHFYKRNIWWHSVNARINTPHATQSKIRCPV